MAIIKIRNAAIDLDAAEIPNLPASKITSGTFANDKLTGSGAITINGSSVALGASTTIATGTDWQSVQTSNFTAAVGKGYPINTTGGAITCTFPGSASAGDTIVLMDYARKFGTNALTINQNSLKFQGYTSPNPIYNISGQTITCTYIDTTQGWIPTSDDDTTMETPQTYSADFLVIAGGGAGASGAHAGGGGAGGFRTASSVSLTETNIYTVTVGAGGTGVISQGGSTQSGSDSSISGSGITTITSAGGGGGAYGHNTVADSGGSGGGGAYSYAGGAGNTPSTSPSQGNDGGDAVAGGPNYATGGGGGAGAVGADGAGAQGGAGGNGTASSITGSAITYAGGGGGGCYSDGGGAAGAGGSGGGGAGASSGATPVAGTVNTGSGGGGGNGSSQKAGGNGGTGVVIISVPTANYSGTTSGSPTVTTSGSNKIIKFTGSGSYTA